MLYNISTNFKLVYFVVKFYLNPFIFLSVFAVKNLFNCTVILVFVMVIL